MVRGRTHAPEKTRIRLDRGGVGGRGGAGDGSVLTYLSLLHHYVSLLQGVFSSRDVIYYLLFSLTFIVLSIHRLDGQRLQS